MMTNRRSCHGSVFDQLHAKLVRACHIGLGRILAPDPRRFHRRAGHLETRDQIIELSNLQSEMPPATVDMQT